MRPRISIRGSTVRPSVHPSVRRSLRRCVTPSHFRRFSSASKHRVASIGSCFGVHAFYIQNNDEEKAIWPRSWQLFFAEEIAIERNRIDKSISFYTKDVYHCLSTLAPLLFHLSFGFRVRSKSGVVFGEFNFFFIHDGWTMDMNR